MKKHDAEWPASGLKAVEIVENGGAWYVSYEGDDGRRAFLRKYNGRHKGFRNIGELVYLLRVVRNVERFSVAHQSASRSA